MMKTKLIIATFAVLALLFVSCDKTKANLSHSWKVSNVEAKGTLSDSIKNVILSTGTLNFTKDGKVSGNLLGPVSGTYELSKDGKTITITDATGAEAYGAEVTPEKLVLDGREVKLTFAKN